MPELLVEVAAEAPLLKAGMEAIGCRNIYLSEGAGGPDIVAEMEHRGETVERDPFGHVKLDTINPGQWFAKAFAKDVEAEKQMVQKSGYYSRSAPAGDVDLPLIKQMADLAVDAALRSEPGVVGNDEERGDELRVIEFERIAGHKPFDVSQPWFAELLAKIGQPMGTPVAH